MRIRRWAPVLLPFTVGLLGIYSSRLTCDESWRPMLGSVYYIPIVIAAIVLGARPALFVAFAAGGAHTLATAAFCRGDPLIEPIAQTLLFVCVALTAARLAQWRGEAPEETPALDVHEPMTGREMLALRRVITGLVRQFRTPMTSIEGAGWVLEDPKLPDHKHKELVGIIRKEAHRLSQMLCDVLDFTQPHRPRFRTINLPALLDDVIQLTTMGDQGSAYTISKNIPPDLPTLQGDPEQIRQVMLNLVMNAIQAMPGGGQIEVSVVIEEDNFVIAVKDHGHGIPATEVYKIFDPFFTTHEHHLGLGLPVGLRIVSEHGGRIAVDCRSGEGTCISVILPASQPL